MRGNSRPTTATRFALTAIAVLLGVPPAAWGYPVYSRYYRAKYRDQGGCNVCHKEGGGSKRNAYGDDWQRSGEGPDAFALIERRDSDGDGAGNLDEIRGGSNPGDSSSTLVNPGHKWRLRHHVPVPVEQMRFALGAAPDFTFRESIPVMTRPSNWKGSPEGRCGSRSAIPPCTTP